MPFPTRLQKFFFVAREARHPDAMLSFKVFQVLNQPSQVLDMLGTFPGHCHVVSGTKKTSNLTSIDGCQLYVDRKDPDIYREFLARYAYDVAHGVRYYLVERNVDDVVVTNGNRDQHSYEKDPVVNLFFELDVQRLGADVPRNAYRGGSGCFWGSAEAWEAAGEAPLDVLRNDPAAARRWVLVWLRVIMSVLAQSFFKYPEADLPAGFVERHLDCVVCVPTGNPKGEGWQYGVHLHFPNIRLQLSKVILLQSILVSTLDGMVPPGPRENPWHERLDRSAYRALVGLRLPGSYKAERCAACGATPGKKRSSAAINCVACMDRGFKHVDRRYMPGYRVSCVGDPRPMPGSLEACAEGVRVAEEYQPELGFVNRIALFRRLMVLCSTKVGIVDGVTREWPPNFVGDSRVGALPRGKAPRRVRQADGSFAYELRPETGRVARSKVFADVPAVLHDTVIRHLVESAHALFGVPQWEGLAAPHHSQYHKQTTGHRTRPQTGKVFVIVKPPKLQYCPFKEGTHSHKTGYFEIYQAGLESVPDVECSFATVKGTAATRWVARIAYRCFCDKVPPGKGELKCSARFRFAEYDIAHERLLFEGHRDDPADTAFAFLDEPTTEDIMHVYETSTVGSRNSSDRKAAGRAALAATQSTASVRRLATQAVGPLPSSDDSSDALSCSTNASAATKPATFADLLYQSMGQVAAKAMQVRAAQTEAGAISKGGFAKRPRTSKRPPP